MDLSLLQNHSLVVDCDVLQADGGTRTAAITGACVALKLAFRRMLDSGEIVNDPLLTHVAAISVGIVDSEILVDLDYKEDSRASVDMNIVMNERREFIEIQGTGESATFTRDQLQDMLDAAGSAISRLIDIQKQF